VNASNLCDPRLVWQKLTPALTTYNVPGSHETMIRPPHVPVLTAQLSQCVNAARARIENKRLAGSHGSELAGSACAKAETLIFNGQR